MSYLLPATKGGLLPYWDLFSAALGVVNGLRCYASPEAAKPLYDKAQVTPLHARTVTLFLWVGTCIRLASAYDITNKSLYLVNIALNLLTFQHYFCEAAIFKASGWGLAVMPVIASSGTALWQILQYGYYTR